MKFLELKDRKYCMEGYIKPLLADVVLGMTEL